MCLPELDFSSCLFTFSRRMKNYIKPDTITQGQSGQEFSLSMNCIVYLLSVWFYIRILVLAGVKGDSVRAQAGSRELCCLMFVGVTWTLTRQDALILTTLGANTAFCKLTATHGHASIFQCQNKYLPTD